MTASTPRYSPDHHHYLQGGDTYGRAKCAYVCRDCGFAITLDGGLNMDDVRVRLSADVLPSSWGDEERSKKAATAYLKRQQKIATGSPLSS